MALLDDIVELLSDEKGSLTQALLKTKVLLHKLNHAELTSWVNDELNGYGADKEVPTYRKVHSRVLGTITNGYHVYPNSLIPIGHLPEKIRNYLSTENLRHSLNVLEQFASDPSVSLVHQLQPEYNGDLGKSLSAGYWVETARQQVEPSQILQTLIEIRSRLLDFSLGLQSKLGDDVTDAGLRQEAAGIDTPSMFAESIFRGSLSFGDHATIVIGHGNSQQITNIAIKGNFTALSAELKRVGISDEDVADLKNAITADVDSPDHASKKLGPAVRHWMTKMMGKAIDLSWQIEVGVAGGLLTSALQAYYF